MTNMSYCLIVRQICHKVTYCKIVTCYKTGRILPTSVYFNIGHLCSQLFNILHYFVELFWNWNISFAGEAVNIFYNLLRLVTST
jgi:hypothetical protein